MKIGIEAQRIFRNGKHGMDVVALELIRQIQLLDNKNQYLLFAKEGEDRSCIQDKENFKTVILNGVTYAGWEQISLPAAVKKIRPHLLHCTANTAPYYCAVPMIVTVHDVIYLEEVNFEGSAYQNLGNLYRKLVVPHAIKKAEKIITVSEFEKMVIADVCKTDPERIVVIHNAVSERFNSNFDAAQLEEFRKRFGLPEKFVLLLGNTAPKKNTAGALKAYAHYCSVADDPMPLVVSDFSRSAVLKILADLKRSDLAQIIYTPGYIPSSEMPLMYNCSRLFLYPSLRESFGLPVLEAMSCGVPVITSDIPAIREVADDAAFFVDPENMRAIAEKIALLLNDSEQRKILIEKGYERANKFRWSNSAKKLIELYQSFE
jgi:glycosyltransferase involved in cell wall biosynthesis